MISVFRVVNIEEFADRDKFAVIFNIEAAGEVLEFIDHTVRCFEKFLCHAHTCKEDRQHTPVCVGVRMDIQLILQTFIKRRSAILQTEDTGGEADGAALEADEPSEIGSVFSSAGITAIIAAAALVVGAAGIATARKRKK